MEASGVPSLETASPEVIAEAGQLAVQHADPALTISIALVAGVLAQTVAHHLRLPGIVLLLAVGAVLGPDVLGVIDPSHMRGALQSLVGVAVAVILFEGGMNLNIRRLKRESRVIQRLIIVGSIVTAAGATLAARLLMDWEWRLAILFGTLVIVTGPTVISPLVRRIKLKPKLQTVLEAEGVLIDPVGAIIAVVALEVIIEPHTGETLTAGFISAVARLGMGGLLGLVGGGFLALLLRPKHVVPENLQKILTLAVVLALFQISNALQHESGIMSVTVAGLVVGNVRARGLRELMEFKEQLTVMLIGMLFVLLAADVRIADVQALGTAGLWTLAALMFVVRPLNVLASTGGAGFTWKEKTFLSWLAPRGIVAAAVASFFALALEAADIDGGRALQAMVFLVIAGTVVIQGLTGGLVARLLGVRRPPNRGYAILGANELSRALGRALVDGGEDVVFLDSNADATHATEEAGFRVVFGNALEERTLMRARLDMVAACVGLTPNEEVNLLFATRVREEFGVKKAYVVLHGAGSHLTPEMVRAREANVLFGAPRAVDLWSVRLRRNLATLERWRLVTSPSDETRLDPRSPDVFERALLPLAVHRSRRTTPIDAETRFGKNDELSLLIFEERGEKTRAQLIEMGWEKVEVVAEDPEDEPLPA